MSMQFVTLRQQEESPGAVTVDQYWYLTEDKSRVVAEGDPAGRWLWASPGTEVPMRDAIRLGAVKVAFVGEDGPEPVLPPVDADPEPPSDEVVDQDAKSGSKAAKPAANKAAKQVPNKAQAKGEDK